MNTLVKIGRAFYGVGIVAFGIQQILVKDFRPQIVPAFPAWAHHYTLLPVVTGVAFILAGLIITGLFTIKAVSAKHVCLHLGIYFLALILFCQLPYILFISPNEVIHLFVWVDMLKELAYCGGAFVMASSFSKNAFGGSIENFTSLSDKLMSPGRIFFSITIILFGYSHFLYTDFVATLVPTWLGMAHFYTLFAGTALIAFGIAIMLRLLLKPAAYSLAIMLFLWVLLLHVPRAFADPHTGNGNEIVSAFDALLFCGIALVIGGGASRNSIVKYSAG